VRVSSWEILPTGTTFRFALPVERRLNTFTLRATPGAGPRGGGDPRRVSIAMGPLDVAPVPGAAGGGPVDTHPACAAQ
jgi:hypothetical protein